jgi:hypothetical protein
VTELLAKLCGAPSPVRISCGDAPPRAALEDFLDDRIVPVLFIDTLGGAELDILIDPAGTQLEEADGKGGAGVLRLVGDLILDDMPVRARIEVALDTMTGWGRLSAAQDSARPDC